jgi:phosphotransferase system  glucose/maltose/N-acetylglucosamine-specific IIC component
MKSGSGIIRTITEGLIFGFTFALGWFFAAMLLGVAVA